MSFGSSGSNEYPNEKTYLADPIVYYKDLTDEYPSNAQIWWAYKRPSEIGNTSPPKAYLDVFDPSMRHQVDTGNAPVSKGHYVLDAFFMNRSDKSGISGLPSESSNGAMPQAVEFHAGRAFYAGVFHPGFNTKIYFSQIIESKRNIPRCYSEADPTAEDVRDLQPSDGGVLEIPEVSRVFRMKSLGPALLVFADNGVWAITGSEGLGFTATDFSISKLSGVPTIGNLSFVDIEGVPAWWNRSGIWTLSPGEQGGMEVVSLTKNTIQSFYDEIPEESKVNAKGSYNPRTRKVEWLYRNTESETEEDIFVYDKSIVLDLETGSWSPWDLSGDWRAQVQGIFTIFGASLETENLDVIRVSDNVLADTDEVIVTQNYNKATRTQTKYVVNVLDDTIGIPEPPDPTEPETTYVFVSDDQVLVNADEVILAL